MADFILTDEGDFIATANIKKLYKDATHVYFDFNDGTTLSYPYSPSSVVTSQFLKYRSEIMATPGSLTFVSASPNSVSHTTSQPISITGTGFFTSGIIEIQFVDGANVFAASCTINSDTNLTTVAIGPIAVTGTYNMNYSVDNVNFVSTGLTLTVT